MFAGLKDQSYNTVNGVDYGVPARPRRERPDVTNPTRSRRCPTSWAEMFDRELAVQGQGQRPTTAPIYIADAALVPDEDPARLSKHHQPVRARRRPSSPRRSALLKASRSRRSPSAGSTATEQMDGFLSGDIERRDRLADHQQNLLKGETPKVKIDRQCDPEGGRHRLVRHLDDHRRRQEPRLNCMLAWIELHHLTRKANADDHRILRRGTGQCARSACEADEQQKGYVRSVPRRRTRRTGRTSATGRRRPSRCVDGRGDVSAPTSTPGLKAWTEVKG